MSAILGFYVNALDSAFEDPDLGAVASGLDHAGLFLDADDLADDSANRGDLVADLKSVAHISGFLFLLLLGSVHKEVEDSDHGDYHDYRSNSLQSGVSGSRRIG